MHHGEGEVPATLGAWHASLPVFRAVDSMRKWKTDKSKMRVIEQA